MIETYNNIIFWVGYILILGILLVLALAMFYEIFQKLMNTKQFFISVFNSALEKRLKGLSEEDFYEWHEKFEQRYKMINHKKDNK